MRTVVSSGMAKTFKSWDVDQVVLLPPSVQALVPAGQLAHFVRDLVRESRDVSAILTPYAQAASRVENPCGQSGLGSQGTGLCLG